MRCCAGALQPFNKSFHNQTVVWVQALNPFRVISSRGDIPDRRVKID